MMLKSLYDLIKSPVITEKSTLLKESGKYIFEVLPAATKLSVKKAVENIFDVKVKSVNIINQVGKRKVFKGVLGSRSGMKKAIVTLEKDFSIDFSQGVN